ncbi:hypothetical protein PISMIDRAFT_14766 [Pisolithus microcarpus 441]|uniref:Uncharacterized protein n=1 Tax=Pisolithus microcarpus 441 TaxID=765257 RepID=A0A0C9ZD60_9AGAM|nr:hypothetical protein PISMIDRAFT_14766 [Pisolithus microcarpus 441]
MEVLPVTTGMPWFYVVVVGTLAWRLASIPLTIVSARNASRLRPFAAQMKVLSGKVEMADQAGKLEIINGHRSYSVSSSGLVGDQPFSMRGKKAKDLTLVHVVCEERVPRPSPSQQSH